MNKSMKKSPITTHILDTSTGKPAANVAVKLFVQSNNEWHLIAQGKTDTDGRITDWLDTDVEFATYKLEFDLDSYYQNKEMPAFYPEAQITFRLQDKKHHHIPLLLSPFGYSTYRGS
ncbi:MULTISPECIES: hydroxyisourate hydrolase [Pseudoalteromonas]|uniref:5-hydroxyisourate hydrolase n=1 Tax=Pseudoalteromonas arctica TaxID=394751 RepID=A0A7X9U4M3_9GAMM|nr:MULTISPECIES: hydroxyisourate hydrolase [Pseudoalteromonas]NMF47507.1 hydroxyisourate hydrolase [Pseudoalteromonas arctica]